MMMTHREKLIRALEHAEIRGLGARGTASMIEAAFCLQSHWIGSDLRCQMCGVKYNDTDTSNGAGSMDSVSDGE